MNEDIGVESIPWEVADKLCKTIRGEAEERWYTASARWCWNCRQEAGGDMNKRGFMRAPGNRGCYLVNAHFADTTYSN